MKSVSLKIASITDNGEKRDHNEDYHSYCTNISADIKDWFHSSEMKLSSIDRGGVLLVLADGMGGGQAGEIASKIAVKGIQQYISKIRQAGNAEQIREVLFHAIIHANDLILSSQKENIETHGMGSTIIIAWILDSCVYISWVGDSRAYKFNPGSGLKLLSKDHSYVQELLDSGQLSFQQAFYHPQKNLITQSLGGKKCTLHPGFSVSPVFNNDRIMLCSDGLNGMILDIEIEFILKEIPAAELCIEKLVQAANEAGGHDNITIILCDVQIENAMI